MNILTFLSTYLLNTFQDALYAVTGFGTPASCEFVPYRTYPAGSGIEINIRGAARHIFTEDTVFNKEEDFERFLREGQVRLLNDIVDDTFSSPAISKVRDAKNTENVTGREDDDHLFV